MFALLLCGREHCVKCLIPIAVATRPKQQNQPQHERRHRAATTTLFQSRPATPPRAVPGLTGIFPLQSNQAAQRGNP